MNRFTALLLIFCGFFVSCTSEYEECLSEAKELKHRYHVMEETHAMRPNNDIEREMVEIQQEIDFLAQVSGNEYLFFQDLNR